MTALCCSTLLRTIYHNQDEDMAVEAAFAETDETGKPILNVDVQDGHDGHGTAGPTTDGQVLTIDN